MKKLLLSLLIFSGAFTCAAQDLNTQTQTIDVGQVIFYSPVTAQFELKNKSSRQIKINKIETSCGCTTANSDRMVVDGGKSMTLNVTYDSKLMGHFEKQIFVYEDGKSEPLALTLKGVVVEELSHFNGAYPYMLGEISADKQYIEFDDVNRGQNPTQEIHIMNTTGETIIPVVMHLPNYLRADVSPTKIQPKRSGVITFTLLSNNLRNDGLTQTSVFLGKFPGDKVALEKEIQSSVVLLPSFDGYTDDMYQYMPHMEISAHSLSMSNMTGKSKKLKGEITIHNTGRNILDISALQMFTAGLKVSLNKTKVAPGEEAKLKIQADRNELKKQKTRPRILMITNDPKNSKVEIEITE